MAKNLKRLSILSAMLLLALTSCGEGGEGSSSEQSSSSEASSSASSSSASSQTSSAPSSSQGTSSSQSSSEAKIPLKLSLVDDYFVYDGKPEIREINIIY